MAPFDGHGRVLPEWTAANLDRMVHPTSAALVSLVDRIGHARNRAGDCLDAVFAPPLPADLLGDRHAVGSGRDPDSQLHLLELPGADARFPAPRRPLFLAVDATTPGAAKTMAPAKVAGHGQVAGCGEPPAPAAAPAEPSRGRRMLGASRARGELPVAKLGSLCNNRGDDPHPLPQLSSAHAAGRGARALPHRQPIWSLRGDDAGPL